MNIAQLLQKGSDELKNISSTPSLDARSILRFLLHLSASQLITKSEEIISEEIQEIFFEAIEKRKNNVPLAYITNSKEFFGRDFFVDERVLIPRPETEELVETVLNSIPQNVPVSVLDLGTGSGCIAITIKKEKPKCEVFAGDISEKALEVAKKNAKTFNADIHFFQTDLLNNFPPFNFLPSSRDSTFNLLIANLPYVHSNERHNSIKHEPELALFSGIDGLNHYRELAKQLGGNPWFNLVFLEIDDRQAEEMKNIFSFAEKIEIIKDVSGKQRIVKIYF